jgi:hypothetical protein
MNRGSRILGRITSLLMPLLCPPRVAASEEPAFLSPVGRPSSARRHGGRRGNPHMSERRRCPEVLPRRCTSTSQGDSSAPRSTTGPTDQVARCGWPVRAGLQGAVCWSDGVSFARAGSSTAEQLTLNQLVGGSNPPRLTTIPRTKRPPGEATPRGLRFGLDPHATLRRHRGRRRGRRQRSTRGCLSALDSTYGREASCLHQRSVPDPVASMLRRANGETDPLDGRERAKEGS